MKDLNKIVKVLLNILFCVALLYFFTQNAFLRPYAGSSSKEIIAGLLLLGSMYANYFLLYPNFYEQNSHIFYWFLLATLVFITAFLDLAIAYPYISKFNASTIEAVGFLNYFAKRFLFIAGRNLAFNFFPFMFRERKQLQQALESEVRVVYKDTQLIDIIDNKDVRLIPKDSIYYCLQDGNYTWIYTVENARYSRSGSLKHLEQLFGKKDFIRISKQLLLPYQYIKKCNGNEVVMKKMPWQEKPLAFMIEKSDNEEIAERIISRLQVRSRKTDNMTSHRESRKPSQPSGEKIKAVFLYIQEHPGCRCSGISAQTQFSSSTVERYIFALKKQGLIKHTGSKRNGGYDVVSPRPKRERMESVQQEENGTTNKIVQETPDKGKPAEPSSKE